MRLVQKCAGHPAAPTIPTVQADSKVGEKGYFNPDGSEKQLLVALSWHVCELYEREIVLIFVEAPMTEVAQRSFGGRW